MQVSCFGEKPTEWVRNLPRSFKSVGGGNPVFDILRSSFDVLEVNEQRLFMDLVVYRPFSAKEVEGCDFEYFDPCLNKNLSWNKLDSLRRKGLLMDVDWRSRRISVHDLYVEFAGLELKGLSDEPLEFENRRFIIASMSDLKKRPSGGCWGKLERVGILGGMDQIVSLKGIKWGYYSNVVVLELKGDHDFDLLCVEGSLNLKGLECLRSLTVIGVICLDGIEGLDGLEDITFLRWEFIYLETDFYESKPSIGVQLPTSLEVLDLSDGWLERDVLSQCNKLHKMTLYSGGSEDLDLINFSSLEIQSLSQVEKLCTLSLPCNSSGLKSLLVEECRDLVEIRGLDDLTGLERLVLKHRGRSNSEYDENFGEWELSNLENFTNLKDLRLMGCRVQAAGLCNLRQLRKLIYCSDKSNKAPSLRGCDQLEVLQLELNRHLGGETNLEGLEDLPAFRTLMLFGCRVSAGWPDLSRLRKLEEIILDYADDIMLQGDDMDMLASLPLLQLVEVRNSLVKLDVRRKKWINAYISEEWDFDISLQSVLDKS